MSIMIVNNDCEKKKAAVLQRDVICKYGWMSVVLQTLGCRRNTSLSSDLCCRTIQPAPEQPHARIGRSAMFLKRQLSKLPQKSNLEAFSRHPQTWMDVE